MINNFLKLKMCVNHTLLDFNLDTFDDGELHLLNSLYKILHPLQIAVTQLSSDTATHIDSEGILRFLNKSIRNQENPFSNRLFTRLKERIDQRRIVLLNTLVIYLHSGCFPKSDNTFHYATKVQTREYAIGLFNKYFKNFENGEIVSDDSSDDSSEHSFETLEEQLRSSMKKINNPTRKSKNNNLTLVVDFDHLDKFKKRTDRLDLLYNALLSINPTSTISERVFSVSSSIKLKQKNRLSPKHLNCVLFLKYYFKKYSNFDFKLNQK